MCLEFFSSCIQWIFNAFVDTFSQQHDKLKNYKPKLKKEEFEKIKSKKIVQNNEIKTNELNKK